MAEEGAPEPVQLQSQQWSCGSLAEAVQVMQQTNNPETLRYVLQDVVCA